MHHSITTRLVAGYAVQETALELGLTRGNAKHPCLMRALPLAGGKCTWIMPHLTQRVISMFYSISVTQRLLQTLSHSQRTILGLFSLKPSSNSDLQIACITGSPTSPSPLFSFKENRFTLVIDFGTISSNHENNGGS